MRNDLLQHCNLLEASIFILKSVSMVPTQTGKPGKKESIFQSGHKTGKSGNFTQNIGTIRKNYTGKLEKNKKILEKSGNSSASHIEIPRNMVPYFT